MDYYYYYFERVDYSLQIKFRHLPQGSPFLPWQTIFFAIGTFDQMWISNSTEFIKGLFYICQETSFSLYLIPSPPIMFSVLRMFFSPQETFRSEIAGFPALPWGLTNREFDYCNDSLSLFNPFSTNVPLMDKPVMWFLLGNVTLPKVFFKHFASENQLLGFYVSGTLVENG